jgi:hypothetical protein
MQTLLVYLVRDSFLWCVAALILCTVSSQSRTVREARNGQERLRQLLCEEDEEEPPAFEPSTSTGGEHYFGGSSLFSADPLIPARQDHSPKDSRGRCSQLQTSQISLK